MSSRLEDKTNHRFFKNRLRFFIHRKKRVSLNDSKAVSESYQHKVNRSDPYNEDPEWSGLKGSGRDIWEQDRSPGCDVQTWSRGQHTLRYHCKAM